MENELVKVVDFDSKTIFYNLFGRWRIRRVGVGTWV